MCGFCDVTNIDHPKQLNLFSDDEINRVIYDIYNGSINLQNLDYHTYKKVADKLKDGVFDGFGKDKTKVMFESPDYRMLKDLTENVYIFSGAKNYQQVREMSSLLTKDGGIVSASEFQKVARPVFDKYNVNYLTAEYNSAIAQSRSASQWMDIEKDKDVLPYLQYVTAGDGRVRPEHAELNGIIKTVDDKFWSMYMPPNGWNCRCHVIQLSEGKVTNTDHLVVKNVPEIFKFNAGKDRIVFSNEHPYYDIAAKDKDFAKTNFNLPIPPMSDLL